MSGRSVPMGRARQGFRSGRSIQQGDGNLTSVEIYSSVNSTLKYQGCRSLCFWNFVSLHPICKIEVHLGPESLLSIRKYASNYGLPLFGRVVGQYVELETLAYLNFRLHLNSLFAASSMEQYSCRNQGDYSLTWGSVQK